MSFKRPDSRRLNFMSRRFGSLWRWNRQSVPKRTHMKFRCRGITQRKEQNITNPVGNYHSKRSVFPISLVNLILFGNFYTNICTVNLATVTLDVRQRPFHATAVTAALALMNRSDSTAAGDSVAAHRRSLSGQSGAAIYWGWLTSCFMEWLTPLFKNIAWYMRPKIVCKSKVNMTLDQPRGPRGL